MFTPATNNPADGDTSTGVVSEICHVFAYVAALIAPDGRLSRNTSTPFRYTTAPSSRRNRNNNPDTTDGSPNSNDRRKYVVVCL